MVPTFRWVWAQQWLDVLFLHWRVSSDRLRRILPSDLELDTYQNEAWASVVAFRLKVRPRGLPYLPLFSDLVEVNLRTYVTCRGVPGVIFLTVEADNRFALMAGRTFTPIAYRHAKIAYRRGLFESPSLRVRFHTSGSEMHAQGGSLDEFLLERYRLYCPNRRGDLLYAEVSHPRWKYQRAEAELEVNRYGASLGLELSNVPDRIHSSAGVPALFGRFRHM